MTTRARTFQEILLWVEFTTPALVVIGFMAAALVAVEIV